MPIIALLAVGCNKDGKKEDPVSDELKDKYSAAAMLINMLADQDLTPDDVVDLGGRTFEPTYGEARDDANPLERFVMVPGEDMAAAYFHGLTSGQEKELDLTDIGLGKVTFQPSDGANCGYVEVAVPCIPHLERITYKTKAQWGENGPSFESPCLWGDVYLHAGQYWICVKESYGFSGSAAGHLVSMQTGKGYKPQSFLSGEDWGCWEPSPRCDNLDYVTEYLYLCADPGFKSQKRRIVEAYPYKVFPRIQRWYDSTTHADIGDATWGFGNLEPNYSYVDYSYKPFTSNPSNSDDPNSSMYMFFYGRASIVLCATEGDYRASKARWWRRSHQYFMPLVCKYDKGCFVHTLEYVTQSEWNACFFGSPQIYTLYYVNFNESVPAGFSLVDI